MGNPVETAHLLVFNPLNKCVERVDKILKNRLIEPKLHYYSSIETLYFEHARSKYEVLRTILKLYICDPNPRTICRLSSSHSGGYMTQLNNFSFKAVNTLVIGAGGGADIITAIAVIESQLFGLNSRKCYPGVAKSSRTNITGPLSGEFKTNLNRVRHASLSLGTHLIQTHPNAIKPSQKGNGKIVQRWKSPLMEECLDRVGAEPYFILHGLKGQDTIDVAKMEMKEFCEVRNIEQIIAVDNGGDIMAEFDDIEDAGRDQKVLEVLMSLDICTYVIVVAPGADGDFTQVELAQMKNRFGNIHEDLGHFDISIFQPIYQKYSGWMGATRTHNIVNESWKVSKNGEGNMTVKRGTGARKRQQIIPHRWIQSGWLFKLT